MTRPIYFIVHGLVACAFLTLITARFARETEEHVAPLGSGTEQ